MENVANLKSGTYIIAVSGGVDSMVLLDMIVKRQNEERKTKNKDEAKLIVAHFDHGVRADSGEDGKFVADLAKKYELEYVSERRELGTGASEDTARKARYDFLFRIKERFNAKQILTAHHQDDVIETMVINLIRGTGWRGLCSLKNTPDIIRPFLTVSGNEIVAYAKHKKLAWREDTTNQNQTYLRNAVRHQLMPKLERQKWVELYHRQCELAEQVDTELKNIQSDKRYNYIMWPEVIAAEVLKFRLKLTRVQAGRALLAIKTGKSGASFTVGGHKTITLTRDMLVVEPLLS